jgi:hypothetical protein
MAAEGNSKRSQERVRLTKIRHPLPRLRSAAPLTPGRPPSPLTKGATSPYIDLFGGNPGHFDRNRENATGFVELSI